MQRQTITAKLSPRDRRRVAKSPAQALQAPAANQPKRPHRIIVGRRVRAANVSARKNRVHRAVAPPVAELAMPSVEAMEVAMPIAGERGRVQEDQPAEEQPAAEQREEPLVVEHPCCASPQLHPGINAPELTTPGAPIAESSVEHPTPGGAAVEKMADA